MSQSKATGQEQGAVPGVVRPVLVPLDGSLLAERALPWGREVAARLGAPLLLARVVPLLPFAGVPDLAAVDVSESVLEEGRSEAASYLDALAVGLRGGAPAVAVRVTARPGDPETVLLELEAESDVQLIVMSTHVRHGLDRWVRGSVAEAMLRRGTAPVLLVRPSDDPAGAADLGRKDMRVLVPLDGSAFGALAMPEVGRIVAPGAAEIVLTGVVPAKDAPADAGASPAAHWDRASAQRYLESAAVGLRLAGRPTTTAVLTADDPAAAIIELATLEEIDLIVMTTHGRGGLGRLLYGSVADVVSRGAPSPVLLVRPHAEARRGTDSPPPDAEARPSATLVPSEGEYPKQ